MKPGALTTILCLITMAFAEGAPKVKMQTFTYKKVGDLEIKADVHRPGDEVRRPVLVYIHGGALINGGRQSINKRIKEMFLGAGYAIVSIDYRLAPETQLPGIIEDLEDAFKWLRRDGARLFNVDTSKIAVAGGSAGGCLTLVSGFRVKPAPTVLMSEEHLVLREAAEDREQLPGLTVALGSTMRAGLASSILSAFSSAPAMPIALQPNRMVRASRGRSIMRIVKGLPLNTGGHPGSPADFGAKLRAWAGAAGRGRVATRTRGCLASTCGSASGSPSAPAPFADRARPGNPAV